MIDDHIEYVKEYLPKYLSPLQQKSLFSELSENFPRANDPNKIYRNLKDIDIFYQGDAINEIPFSSLNLEKKTFEMKFINGAILSNTCDIASENKRDFTPYVNIAAIHRLDDFIDFLKSNDITEEKIKSFTDNLRNNLLSTLFFLPQIRQGDEIIMHESFIRFDHTTCLPLDFINNGKYDKKYLSQGGDRLFTFSNYGFYIFLFKLSVHYCRIREGVFRD